MRVIILKFNVYEMGNECMYPQQKGHILFLIGPCSNQLPIRPAIAIIYF
jgi:hypothetical protein